MFIVIKIQWTGTADVGLSLFSQFKDINQSKPIRKNRLRTKGY